MDSKLVSFIYEWLGRKRTKKHIVEEMRRHYSVALHFIKYASIFYLLIIAYYYFNEKILLLNLYLISISVFFVSSFAPDLLYLAWKIVRNNKSYVPSEKRIYSHSMFGLSVYAAAVLLLFLPLGMVTAVTASTFAFFGYWIHITTDKVELIIDKIKEFIKSSIKE